MPRRKEWGASVFVVNSAYAEEREDMATIVTPMNERRWIGRAGARLGFWLGIAALVLLAAGPLGWRTGLMHYRVGLIYLMPAAALAAAAAVIVSLVSFGWWRSLARRRRVLAAIGLVLGAAVLSAPLQAYLRRGTAPSIHDITTDTANPPAFVAALPARAAENGSPVAYSADTARQQRAAFPDIAPVVTALPPADAFKRALETARGMPGWTIVSSDATQGRIEAYQQSLFYGFTDDVVIRVAVDGSGSRIDMRSVSRQGRGDFGVNAKRVRAYLAALKQRLG
jgi:uncharacterized protein (DUF1499 family)